MGEEMKYSEKVIEMLRKAVSGEVKDFWKFSFEFIDLFGGDVDFSQAWYKENPALFEYLGEEENLDEYFEVVDTNDTESIISHLQPIYEKSKTFVL